MDIKENLEKANAEFSSSPIIEDKEAIENVLANLGAYDVFIRPKTEKQKQVIRRTLHWLSFGNILGKTKITIKFREKTTNAGKCSYPIGSRDWLEFTYSSIFTEDDFSEMIGTTCPHEVAHAMVHMEFPNGGTEPHGEEWKTAMWKMLGIKPTTTHTMDTIKQVRARGGGYAFCGCDQGRGKRAVSPRIIKSLRAGEALICPRCKSQMLAESEGGIEIWKSDVAKEILAKARKKANEEMENRNDEIKQLGNRNDYEKVDMTLYCQCPSPNNSMMLSEMNEKETIICAKCNSNYYPRTSLQ